jgi:pyruvate formate lyase activating enzyme
MDALVFNIQRYSLQDGPGIRTTVFFKGCPLSCVWCQNPESRSRIPEILVVEGRCVRCGACRRACGRALEGEPSRDEGCLRCGTCVDACPTGARNLVGRWMTVEEILAEIERDRLFHEESGGGATFSGGEPLLQADPLCALLEECRARGIHTAVDTCGYAPLETLLRVAARADMFLYDLKLLDEERHRTFTGVSNLPILRNLEALARAHPVVRIRVPIIPGINDDPREIQRIALYATSLPGVRELDLLGYHATGLHKYDALGEAYPLGEIDPPSPERLEEIAGRFRAAGLQTRTHG